MSDRETQKLRDQLEAGRRRREEAIERAVALVKSKLDTIQYGEVCVIIQGGCPLRVEHRERENVLDEGGQRSGGGSP